MQLESHSIAGIFPMMDARSISELAADIKTNGLQQPIELYEGKILDGRNRYTACMQLGIEPRTKAYTGSDPVSYVVSLNLRRRHLDESQRAMVAARIAKLPHGGAIYKNNDASIEASTQRDAAEMLNVSRSAVQRARQVQNEGASELVAAVESGKVAVSTAADLSELPKAKQAEIVARGEKEILAAAKEIRTARTEERRAERIEKIAEISKGNKELLLDKTYPIIYADPPWKYEHEESESRIIQYPTMTLEEIKAMGVDKISSPDCLLFLWTTSPKLEESFEVIKAWGFIYRTCMVWVKDKIGMGYYARQQHEVLLIAKKGEIPPPLPALRPPSIIHGERKEHSAKPECVYEIIESMYPELSKIELFARNTRPNWAAWGNQSNAA